MKIIADDLRQRSPGVALAMICPVVVFDAKNR
jgi:hypothetical protein